LTEGIVVESELTEAEREKCITYRKLRRKVRSTRTGLINLSYKSGKKPDGSRMVPSEVINFVPNGKSFSFDTVWDVTRLRFHDFRQREEIQNLLPFNISTGSISNISREGLIYFKLCQFSAARKLGVFFRKSAFILNIDGTNEGGDYVHYRCIDNLTGIVLLARKIRSENADDIADILREVVSLYGRPHAVVSDMNNSAFKAVRVVFGNDFPHLICHFHFLRDVGKDLLKESHDKLRVSMSKKMITSKLNKYIKSIKQRCVKADSEDRNDLMKVAELLRWTLDYRNDLNGKGMPFDLAWLQYFTRVKKAYETICFMLKNKKKPSNAWKTIINIKRSLDLLMADRKTVLVFNKLQKLNALFLKLRDAFYEDINTEKNTLPMSCKKNGRKTILPKVKIKLESIVTEIKTKGIFSQGEIIILEHLEKHMKRLTAELKVGKKLIPMPRTNNTCEVNYRETKRGIRRTTGKKNLGKTMDLLPAEMAYIKNIDNQLFMRKVFGEKEVYEMFSEISMEQFTKALASQKEDMPEYLIGKPIRSKTFIEDFIDYFAA
jgi:hypothetical protein